MARSIPPRQDVVEVPEKDVAVRKFTGGCVISGKTNASAGRYGNVLLNGSLSLVPQLDLEGQIVTVAGV